MIDWHSHILPAMDDGSKDPDESMAMIDALAAQGVDTVIATPHFYANDESVETFLSRRANSYRLLQTRDIYKKIRVICGAEVRYYPGISRMGGLDKLTIGESKLLLLEMPFAKWSEHTIKELLELANMRGLRIIMAHIERYPALRDSHLLETLINNGIQMQVNASFFERFHTKRKAIKLLASGYIHFLGSDCHNMTTRAPKMDVAYDFIRNKLGKDFKIQMNEYGYEALGHKSHLYIHKGD